MRSIDWILLGVIAAFLWLAYTWWNQPGPETRARRTIEHQQAPSYPKAEPARARKLPAPAAAPQVVTEVPQTTPQKKKTLVLKYKTDDGIITVLGDVAVGVPTTPNAPEAGNVQLLPFKIWKSGVIPYYIQPDVDSPERIRAAFQLFQGTGLQFVEYTNQPEALAFETTSGICKSYLGRVGGRQPVWIAPNCGAPEIAHEIMHALGFVHEQNRSDRDDYIKVNFDNIEETYRFNFEKLPQEFMRLSGNSSFDFNSLMLYPPWMFATGGQSTMESKIPDQQIAPGQVLSKWDIDRINRVYGAPH